VRSRQWNQTERKPLRSSVPDEDFPEIDELPSVTIEDLAEIFYRLHWRGRMDEYRRTVRDRDGDWAKLSVEWRDYWRAEAKLFIGRMPLDHVVPRCLDGPNDLSNLQLQPWPEAEEKDHREAETCRAYCNGEISLEQARGSFKREWP
jgi:hypothetical protein